MTNCPSYLAENEAVKYFYGINKIRSADFYPCFCC